MISKNQGCFIWYFLILLFIPFNVFAFANSIPATIKNDSDKDWTVKFIIYPGSVEGDLCKNNKECVIKAHSQTPILYEMGFGQWIKGLIILTDSTAYANNKKTFRISYWSFLYPNTLYVENASQAGTIVEFSDSGDITIKLDNWFGIPY